MSMKKKGTPEKIKVVKDTELSLGQFRELITEALEKDTKVIFSKGLKKINKKETK